MNTPNDNENFDAPGNEATPQQPDSVPAALSEPVSAPGISNAPRVPEAPQAVPSAPQPSAHATPPPPAWSTAIPATPHMSEHTQKPSKPGSGFLLPFVVGLAIPLLIVAGFISGAVWQSGKQSTVVVAPTVAPQPGPVPAPVPSGSTTPQPGPSPSEQPTEPKPTGNESADIIVPAGVSGPAQPYTSGDPNAPIIISVVEDLSCSFCAQFHQNLSPILQEAADAGKIRYDQYVVNYLGEGSVLSNNALGCAANQGKFKEFIDGIYSSFNGNQGPPSQDKLESLAKESGVPDMNTFKACFKDSEFLPYASSVTDAALAAKVPGTPAVFINGEFVDPSLLSEQLIRDAIAGKTTQ